MNPCGCINLIKKKGWWGEGGEEGVGWEGAKYANEDTYKAPSTIEIWSTSTCNHILELKFKRLT